MKRFLLAICLVAYLTPPTFGQVIPGGGHIHDKHPTWWHVDDKTIDMHKRTVLEESWVGQPYNVTVTLSEPDILLGEWHRNWDCNSSELTISVSRERMETLRLESTTGETIGSEGAVGASLDLGLTHLTTQVTVTADCQSSWSEGKITNNKETYTISTKKTVQPCQQVYYRYWTQNKQAEGFLDTAEHRVVCECMAHAIGVHMQVNYCKKDTVVCFADGYGAGNGEWIQRGLVDPCACDNIVDGTEVVHEPDWGEIPPPTPPNSGAEN